MNPSKFIRSEQHDPNKKPGSLLRLPAVMARIALGRSSIYAAVTAGNLAAPVRLSARAVAWREEDIDQFILERTSKASHST